MITSNLLSRAKTPLKVLLLLSLTALASIPSAWAQPSGNPPERIAYQGFLTDNTGTVFNFRTNSCATSKS
jgi:hypothetical protein